MLLVRSCPHTGVVNFFDEYDPHIAVGSISRCGTAAGRFAWRCYTLDTSLSGIAPDLSSAERRLVNTYAMTAPEDRSPTYA